MREPSAGFGGAQGRGDRSPVFGGRARRSAAALLDQFDQADGGVETTIEVECPSCLGVQDVQLPFERGFFLPTAKATGKLAKAAL